MKTPEQIAESEWRKAAGIGPKTQSVLMPYDSVDFELWRRTFDAVSELAGSFDVLMFQSQSFQLMKMGDWLAEGIKRYQLAQEFKVDIAKVFPNESSKHFAWRQKVKRR